MTQTKGFESARVQEGLPMESAALKAQRQKGDIVNALAKLHSWNRLQQISEEI